jgi:Tol biopolymer transport system component
MAQQMAFLAQRSGYAREGKHTFTSHELYTVDAEGSQLHQLTVDLNAHGFSWSPDGRRIACLAQNLVANEPPTYSLYVLEADGSHLRCLFERQRTIRWQWAPDSRQLVITQSEEPHLSPSGPATVSLLNLESGEQRTLSRELVHPFWSPQTQELAFLWKSDPHRIWVMDADGSKSRAIFQSPMGVSPYGWSSDGKYLATYVWTRSQWGPGYEDADYLYILDAQGQTAFQWDRGASMFAWAPDSQRLACVATYQYFEDEEDQADDFISEDAYIYVLSPDGSSIQAVAPAATEVGITWAPDGQKLAFVHEDDGRYALGVLDLAEARLHLVPMGEKGERGHLRPDTPTWSPDGQQIAFTPPGNEGLYVVDLSQMTAPWCVTDRTWLKSTEPGLEDLSVTNPAWQPVSQAAL